jgi:hypothetical protein
MHRHLTDSAASHDKRHTGLGDSLDASIRIGGEEEVEVEEEEEKKNNYKQKDE